MPTPILLAGYPDRYPNVYHRVRLACGDMTVFFDDGNGNTAAIVRNIEMKRLRATDSAREVFCPEELVPAASLHSDRNTAFAQAAAELLKKRGVTEVTSDQMLPLLIADVLREEGITVHCDRSLGIMERRAKDDWEVEQLRRAQAQTEAAIRHAFEIIRDGEEHEGVLFHEGDPLTSERLRAAIAMHLLNHGFASPDGCIAAGGAIGADCHHAGTGPLRTGESIIVDVFPLDLASRYHGDCTRTFCRGPIPDRLAEMHQAVVEAKAAAIGACRAGVRASSVHAEVVRHFESCGYFIGLPPEDADPDTVFYPHGTGHAIGLEVHEPPIIDERGPELIVGDALTIEPGLYCRSLGGVRVEDLIIVRADGAENLNHLPEGLWWE